jgi:hypothetical protein
MTYFITRYTCRLLAQLALFKESYEKPFECHVKRNVRAVRGEKGSNLNTADNLRRRHLTPNLIVARLETLQMKAYEKSEIEKRRMERKPLPTTSVHFVKFVHSMQNNTGT